MGIFKTIDEKFEEIGFEKVEENKFNVKYRRKNSSGTQKLVFLPKKNGHHIVQSYDPRFCVGLTMYEMQLCLKKMKEMGWKPKKEKQ